MKTSESINELAAALAKAQGAIQNAKKGSANPFFGSKYSDLADIINAIREPLAANGLSYTQRIVTNDNEECGVEMLLMHASGQWILYDPFFLPVAKVDAQGFGSAATYARRYLLGAAIGVASDGDDDANAAAKNPGNMRQQTKEAFEALSDEVKDYLYSHAKELIRLHEAKSDLLAYVAAENLDSLDDESKMGLWYLLPSKVRSAIQEAKRIAALMKGKAQTEAA